jgi:sugar-specific transcriptional regulator TrmB
LGVASVKKIALTARIDRGDAHRQIEILQEKTLVEKIIRIPNEYKPMPLNEALKMLIQQKNKENAEMQQKVNALLRKGGHADTDREEENKTSIIPQDDYRKHYATRIIENAQKEIMWYTQIERIPIALTYYNEAWKRTYARGVRHRVIAEVNKPTDKILRFIQKYKMENPNFTIRFTNPTLLVTFDVCDNKFVNLSTEELRGLANSQILSTNNAQVVKVIKDYFELRWKAATKEYPKKRFTVLQDAM